jgi:hypothetical protein
MSIAVHWKKKGHTVCRMREGGYVTRVPLWAFNLMWWRGAICRVCVPEPVLSKAHADKVGWPW